MLSMLLQEGLEARGFSVVRLNTYNTVQVHSLPSADVAAAKQARVVAFASPSAVKAWLACVGDQQTADVAIACIGKSWTINLLAWPYFPQIVTDCRRQNHTPQQTPALS